MNLSQRQLHAFVALAELGSFTRAAERMHISQSGLSAILRDLERQLDCRLFDRTTRSVTLTYAGEQLVPVATRVLSELNTVSAAISKFETRARRILTVAVTPLIAATVMPSASRAFHKLHPEINLRVRDIDRQRIQDGVASGELDVGFGAFFNPTAGIESKVIAEFAMAHVFPAARHAGGVQTPDNLGKTTWSALRDEQLIGLPAANDIQQLIELRLKPIKRANEDRPTYENLQTLLAMVEAKQGTAILPTFIAPACRRYRVRMAILEEPRVPLNYYQITRKGALVPPEIASLAATIRNGFQLH
ncbi:LysR family transcriptional regulator [Noviherbaspirillum pedocola]|uniref:LysR family transcriptional regulator n=1 Tax=Noviherbaspirillum pedocola TaxID=2801341 RepID=A0A934SUU2_9BURK|nr:LysR family transcriptional regulator [Noviherbaspirillum pedocola]MBK4736132.1 LysR family transcriptional regulator [Noviherbaspirillum pedocola]